MSDKKRISNKLNMNMNMNKNKKYRLTRNLLPTPRKMF